MNNDEKTFDDETVDDAELARRAAAPRSEFVDARTLLDAIDKAAGRPNRQYSNADGPRLSLAEIEQSLSRVGPDKSENPNEH